MLFAYMLGGKQPQRGLRYQQYSKKPKAKTTCDRSMPITTVDAAAPSTRTLSFSSTRLLSPSPISLGLSLPHAPLSHLSLTVHSLSYAATLLRRSATVVASSLEGALRRPTCGGVATSRRCSKAQRSASGEAERRRGGATKWRDVVGRCDEQHDEATTFATGEWATTTSMPPRPPTRAWCMTLAPMADLAPNSIGEA